ncbi:glycosyltransferase [Aureitalea sp. L0-47]|uniref:glycosyltransferase n=1 Tax=Aureitalea sp. L0-47 TaxID=2816962 RepID=UPI002237A8DE|nr:glycosyltransferase family 4 protein [Aureitalea sp. L0-47]MCW5520293.1 glycosyltransferase [Aureitalea sp. L0-47]
MKKLFVIGRTFPEPTTTAAGRRMMQLLDFFRNETYEIHFGSTAATTNYSAVLEDKGISTHELQLNDPSFDDLLRKLNPDVVLFDRFISEEQFGWRVAEICPDALKILDTEDLHFLRDARKMAVKSGIPVEKSNLYTDLAKRELASIFRSDLSLIISEYEINLLENTFQVPKGLLCYLPLGFEKVANNELPGFKERSNFVTIGNFQHAPNLDSVLYLARELWPAIRKKVPNSELHIYGAYVPKQVSELHDESTGFLVKGWTEDVSDVMKNARVCLAPLRFGAGLKGKVLNAMYYGTPSVTTSIGAEGISGKRTFGGYVTDDPKEFVKLASDLYTSEEKWSEAQKSGTEILTNRFNWPKVLLPFQKKLNELSKSLESHRRKHFIGQVFQQQTVQATRYMSKWIEEKNKR